MKTSRRPFLLERNPGDLMYYGIDGSVRYSFMNAIKSKVIDPSLNLVEVILP
jgi:hypothetical protein